ncbi:glycoside hydrolase family 3 C-terminal domain-containing protein [Actinotalea sp. C106]|uniref:glycoside hydrolase family 3 C-terminal domain-containing protein n=1 Tax=Actinotalea sp. C106 TaxID=2908644 RepID=UPI0020298FBF|nr:glycoside hydrolase family 3 C-terminal domain-containing protein [Actinotalea sp. C106]
MTEVSGHRRSLEQAAALLVGADMSSTRAGAGVARLVLADGPSGLAMNLPDFSGKVPATSFPAPVALGASWDAALVEEVAGAIGREARAAGADVLLGPSINIKRSPLGGRNFEYYAEDPVLAGHLAAAFVRGVQGAGVGACLKHFAVNSQETDRMRVSAEVGEQALREIYLAAFEHVVTVASPAMVMASYNRVNGTYAAQHPWLLTQVLREEWGFDGAVVSDWGAVDDPVAAVAAGLDVQMPGPAEAARSAIVDAVPEGRLAESSVHEAADRVASLAARWAGRTSEQVDQVAHDELAVRAAAASFVLLRNDGEVLPLDVEDRLLVVGELAVDPHREGGGSAHVQADAADSPLDAVRRVWRETVEFTTGHDVEDAARRARGMDAVVVVVGPPAGTDTEGRDRDTLDLPADQVRLVQALGATGVPTVVVINAGGVVATSRWDQTVGAVLDVWLPGAGGSRAIAEVLRGAINPSGKLPETFPIALEDTATWPGFPATGGRALHAEGVLVGYRWFDRASKDVAYPFGHGLSYTRFAYADLQVRRLEGAGAECRFTLTNTGQREGAEVWQVYVAHPGDRADQPVRRLVAFGKEHLAPGESVAVTVELGRRAFTVWDDTEGGWTVAGGSYAVELGASSRDLRGRAEVVLDGERRRSPLGERSTLREWVEHDEYGPRLIAACHDADPSGSTVGFLTNPTVLMMIGDMPIARLLPDPGNALSEALLREVLGSGDPA